MWSNEHQNKVTVKILRTDFQGNILVSSIFFTFLKTGDIITLSLVQQLSVKKTASNFSCWYSTTRFINPNSRWRKKWLQRCHFLYIINTKTGKFNCTNKIYHPICHHRYQKYSRYIFPLCFGSSLDFRILDRSTMTDQGHSRIKDFHRGQPKDG